VIGRHELERLRIRIHANEIRHLVPKIPVHRNAEGRWVRVDES